MRLPLLTACLMLICICQCGTSPPTWNTNSSFKCGSVTLISSDRGSNANGTYTVTYTGDAYTERPQVVLGWLGMESATTSEQYLAFKANILGQNATDFVIQYWIYNSCSLKMYRLGYFAKSINITYVFVGYLQTAMTNLQTGYGDRNESSLSSYPNGNTIDLTHAYYVMPFITGITMDKGESANFTFKLETSVYNSSQYKVTYSTSGGTLVATVIMYYIVYDQTTIQQTKYSYMDSKFFIGQNSAAQAYSLVYSATTNYFAGLNSFDIDNSGGFSLNFSTESFQLTTITTYNWVNISTWNHRNRSCPIAYPYYLELQNLCYDVCPANYFANTTWSFCQSCDYTCYTCTSSVSTACSSCLAGSYRTLNESSCPCNSGYFDSGDRTCETCSSNCAVCTSASVCQRCITNFKLDGASCVVGCDSGFSMVNGTCTEICGDGYLYVLGCDDGNNVNGDGCSESCLVEADYVCKDGSSIQASVCSYNKTLDFSLSLSLKDSLANKLTMSFSVTPQLKLLDTLNFTSLVQTNLTNTKITTSYSKGKLIVYLQYSSSIQATYAEVKLNPPPNQSNAYAMKVSSASFFVDPDNNLPADYSSADEYSKASSIAKYIQVCIYTLLVCTLAGMFVGGVLVIEILNSIQILVLLMSTISRLPLTISSISLQAKLAHGYNQLMNDFPNIISSIYQSVPKNLYAIGYKSPFFYNLNYMLGLQVLVLFVSGVVLLISALCNQSKLKGRTAYIGSILFKDMFMLTVLFSVTNLGYSFGVNCLYNSGDTKNSIHVVLGCGGLILVLISMTTLLVKAQTSFEVTREHFQQDKFSKVHPLITIVFRLLVGFFMAMAAYWWSSVIVLVVEATYLVFVILKRPYKQKWMFVRGVVNQSLLCLTMLAALFYRSQILAFDSRSPPISTILEWVMILAPGIWTVMAVATLVHLTYRKLKKHVSGEAEQKKDGSKGQDEYISQIIQKEKDLNNRQNKIPNIFKVSTLETGDIDQEVSQNQFVTLNPNAISSRRQLRDGIKKIRPNAPPISLTVQQMASLF